MERKLIAVAVSSALALPMAAHAVEGSVSGHVNRAIINVDQKDNEKDGDLQHVDANSSGSRFRFTGSEDLGNGATAGVQLEYALSPAVRHANVYLSGGFGKLTIGQASTATDSMAHARLGGPSWLAGVTNWCSYVSSGAACPSNDGHRREVLRYDTPAIGPVSIAASYGEDDYWDVAATIASSMDGGYGYDFRIGYIGKAPPSEFGHADLDQEGLGEGIDSLLMVEESITAIESSALTVSGAVSFGQGTSVAVAWSDADAEVEFFEVIDVDVSHSYFYAELDHSYGDGSVGVYYKTGEYDLLNAKIDGTLWGVGIGHNVGGGATAYAGYRHIKSDGEEDIGLMLAGMRVTFN